MIKNLFLSICLIIGLTKIQAQTTRVMTYNLRLDAASDGDDRWDARKAQLANQVLFYEPDFMGVQEALPQQMIYLDSALTAYDYIGVGRDDGKSQGEHSAIFYNKSRFKVLEQHTFWLSPTPDKPSKGWDAAYNRVCTYGLFENIKTKQKFWVFNTHFDHVGNVARMESAKMILEKIKIVNKQKLPFVLTGDFNLTDDNESIKRILTELDDSKQVSKLKHGPAGTWNAFEFDKPVTERLDYIFVPKKGVIVTKYAVLSDSNNKHYLSDHLAVLADLTFEK